MQQYVSTRLKRDEMPDNPLSLFLDWYAEAQPHEPWKANAVVLSTAGEEGRPSSRVVLLGGADGDGLRVFSNYESRKAVELEKNTFCSMVFWWPSQVRQVRVEGVACKLSSEKSDAYFELRPRGSQLGAWASPQSRVISSRRELEERVEKFEASFRDKVVPRPSHWGGYLVKPHRMEFWQGGEFRLHDRFCYVQNEDAKTWTMTRLAP